MFVCNLKLNLKKILIISAVIIVAIALFFEICNMLKGSSSNNFDYVLDTENFTEILKTVHDNIDANVGKTIKVSGFVFRLPDFRANYFVCGRNMLLDDDEKVVGFLCTYNGDMELADNEWVEITGTIVKGYYTTDMPVIEITSINKITAPTNTFVKTPVFLTN
ncbi:MAG: hypothetical protein IJ272_00895 [Clostridia bacterium]|nr:hypothetical protein [Clostridia bacterium]